MNEQTEIKPDESIDENISKPDTYSYKGWLNSDNFWKRSFGILFYYTISSFIVSALLIAFFILIMLSLGEPLQVIINKLISQ